MTLGDWTTKRPNSGTFRSKRLKTDFHSRTSIALGTMDDKELQLERRCRNYARSLGWVCCKLEKNAHKGIPDDLFISPSQECFLIEFKKDEKQKPRPEQAVWLARFSKIAFLVGSFEQFKKVLNLP